MHTSSNRGGTVKLLLWSSIGSVWNWQWRESECLQSLPLPLKPLPDCNDIEKPVLLVLCWLVKEVWQVEVKVVSVSKRQCPGTCQQFCSDTWIHANVVGRFWKEKKPMQMKSAQTEPGFFFNSVSHVILFLLCFVSFHFKAWQSWTKKSEEICSVGDETSCSSLQLEDLKFPFCVNARCWDIDPSVQAEQPLIFNLAACVPSVLFFTFLDIRIIPRSLSSECFFSISCFQTHVFVPWHHSVSFKEWACKLINFTSLFNVSSLLLVLRMTLSRFWPFKSCNLALWKN